MLNQLKTRLISFLPLAAIALMAVLFVPFVASAQTAIQDTLARVLDVITRFLIPISIGFAILYFIWGLITYITAGGDDTKMQKGKHAMTWGLVAMAIIFAIWGFAALIVEFAGVRRSEQPIFPFIPTP